MKITASPFALLRRKARALHVLGLVLLALLPLSAEADRAQARRLYVNANGDLALIGNMLVHCSGTGTNCTNARNGVGNLDNYSTFTATGDFALVDVDGDSSTTNSSSATLNMPAGSTVLWAGLYWGSRYSTSTGAPALSTAQTQLKFRTPAMAGYQTIMPTQVDTNGSAPSTSGSAFQAFADVTALVQAGGNGTYFGAGITTAVARNAWAGWSLIVVYENASLPFRNFAVYDGFGYISNTTVNLNPTGFLTPYSGPVVSRLGVVLWDGDRTGTTSERLLLNGSSITNTANPAGDVWNSTISDLGNNVASRNPNYLNTLGVDIDRFNVPVGVIPNGATSATIGIRSPGTDEVFWFGVSTFMTDIYVPEVIPNVVKTAQDMSPSTPLLRGDTLRWNVVMSNTGLDSATNLVAIDNIPPYLTYKPGSLVIGSGANAGAKSDGSSDDQAEFLTGPDRVVFRLGSGATATQGGTLAYNQSTSFYFDTIVNADAPAGASLTNQVQVQYNSQTLPATTFAASSAAATATVMGPPTISKSFSPSVIDANQSSTLSITVSNPAANPQALTGVAFSDVYPAGLVNAATPNPQVSCTPGSTAGTLSGGSAGGNGIAMTGATIAANGSCIVTVSVTSASIGNYLNTTSVVSSSNGGNGAAAASAVLYVGKPRISKAFAPSTINANGVSTITFTLQNLAASPLSQVAFSDALVNMQVAATPGLVNNCGGSVAASAGANSIALSGGNLPASGNCTIQVNVTSNVAGVLPNTTTGVSSTESGAAGQPSNTAELTVIGPPLISKSFFPVSVRTATPSTMTITVSNPNPGTTLNSVAFSDTYPANLVNSPTPNATLSCTAGSSGTLTGGSAGGSSIGLSGATLAGGGVCTVTVDVQSGVQATYTNTTGAVSSHVGSGLTASSSLIVANRLSATKTFADTSIAYNNPPSALTSSTMTITLSASSGTAVTGVNFLDEFPAGMIVAATPGASTSCSGATLQGRTGSGAWGAVAAGNTALRLVGASMNGGSSCTVVANVTSASTARYTNSTGTIYSSNGGTGLPATASLDVLGPVQVSKVFDSDTIASGGSSVLTITLSNPTTATASLSGVGVVDPFPSGVTVHTTPGEATTCTGTGTAASRFQGSTNGTTWVDTIASGHSWVRLQNVTLAAGASCTASITVRSTTPGIYVNTTNAVTSSNGGTGGTATSTLYVAQPTVTKGFSCTQPILAGASCSSMYIDMTAPSGSALASAQLTDIFPYESATGGFFTLANATLTLSKQGSWTGSCPTFTFQGRTGSSGAWGTVAVGNTAIRATTTGSIPAGGSCRVTATVTSTQTATNTINAGDLTGTIGGNTASNADPASAVLSVYATPQVEKSFASPSILVGGSTGMTIQLTNLNATAATGVAFTDVFPGETGSGGPMVLADNSVTNTCTGTGTVLQGRTGSSGSWGTPAAGNTALRLVNGAIGIGSVCEVTVNISSTTAGSYTNSTGVVSTANVGNAGAASATLVVMAPPTLAKAFTPNAIFVGENSLLTITLSNPNSRAVTGVVLNDVYPSGLVNSSSPNASSSCSGGSLGATPGGNGVSLSGATIPANGSCSISVQVTSAVAGSYTNSTGAVSTTNAGSGTAASAVLTVSAHLPVLNLTKLVSVISDPVNSTSFPKALPGSISSYTITLTNSGPGTVDSGSLFISDTLPTQVELFVGAGSGDSTLLQGFSFTGSTSPSSGLSCSFLARNDGSDCIDFSSDGSSFSYTPNPDADGFDANIKAIRFRPTGVFSASGSGNPAASFQFRVRLK